MLIGVSPANYIDCVQEHYSAGVSPAFLLFGIFLSTLPIPSRRRSLLPTTL
jgi:hypothetical protein